MRILRAIIKEIKGILKWTCPYCGSTNIHYVRGWPKMECYDCGESWKI